MPNTEGNPVRNGLHRLCEKLPLARETTVPIHNHGPKWVGTEGTSWGIHQVQTLAVEEEGSA